MLRRCESRGATGYAEYGGKGITVCGRWHEFVNFLEDMGERPANTTLDRFPNFAGNYEPGNCRWATPKEQANNRATNRVFMFGGEQKTLKQISDEYSIGEMTLSGRLAKGMMIEEAIHWPIAQQKIEYEGVHRTIKEIAAMCGVKPATLWYRIKKGWTIADATAVAPTKAKRWRKDAE